jgi:ribosomal-protein-alanine N-acetyltransferase
VLLRALRADDFPAWRAVRLQSRDWLEPWEPMPDPGTPDPSTDPDAFRARCGAWDRQRQFDAAYGFGLFRTERGNGARRAEDEEFVGEVSLGSVQRGPFQSAYIGYWVAHDHAGRGYVPEGVALIMRFAFDELRLHRLEAAIVPRNRASRRVAEKLGMREEGVALRFLQIRGVYEDHVRYAITREEWDSRREEIADRFLS